MLPELFTVFGVTVQSYGLSKALAILVAGLVLARAYRRNGLSSDARRRHRSTILLAVHRSAGPVADDRIDLPTHTL